MADALDLAHRLPQLWGRVQALEVRVSYARLVARRTRDLSREEAAYVDGRVVESADGRIPWTRFETLVEAAIVAADPEAAAQREQAAAREQFARATRSDEHGMRGFYIRGPFAVIARLDATVAYVADALKALGDDSPEDQRRVKAILILANPAQAVRLLRAYADRVASSHEPVHEPTADRADPPPAEQPVDWGKLLPAVTVYVHVYGGVDHHDGTGVARVEGYGPVTETYLRDVLGPQARFRVVPVVDIEGQAPVDGYEIPDRHRQAVHLMTPADTFPYAPNTSSRTQQIDHTDPYQHDRPGTSAKGAGQSRVGNYGPMTIGHHRIKTHGRWQVTQPFPGIYLWRDRHGATYLVDHTGTRRLRPADRSSGTCGRVETRFSDLVMTWAA